jgi:S-adenosylmethionine hydrolase
VPPPVIAILTDFGTRDHYVGAMKGAVLTVCPSATLVDITHDVPPQDLRTASFELLAAFRYFPPRTVFLVVVDPGVGSERRGIAVEAGDYQFVAPDNGVLSPVLGETPPQRIVSLTNPRYRRPVVSQTFEGRDRFGPAAAWLAAGTSITSLGEEVQTIERLTLPHPVFRADAVEGEVLHIDRFGNLVTNILRDAIGPRDATVHIGRCEALAVVSTYSDVASGTLCALIGSTGRLEIACNGGNAAAIIGAARGDAVRVARPA